MVGSKSLLADRQGAFVKRLGLGVAPLILVEPGQVVEVAGDIGMVGSERLLVDREGAF
jgi:hypothetical protein